MSLVTSQPQNIQTIIGNGFAIYLDNDGNVQLKDVRGKTASLASLLPSSSGANIYNTNGQITEARTVSFGEEGSLIFGDNESASIAIVPDTSVTITAPAFTLRDTNTQNTITFSDDNEMIIRAIANRLQFQIGLEGTADEVTVGQALVALDANGTVGWGSPAPAITQIYLASLTQSGEDAPSVANEVVNNTGQTFTWVRDDVGQYSCTLAGVWQSLSYFSVPLFGATNGILIITDIINSGKSGTLLQIRTFLFDEKLTAFQPADDILSNTPVYLIGNPTGTG